jgi:hypothetical protein
MAAATAIIGGIALAGGLAQTGKGIADSRKANRLLNNYERQDLYNSYSDIQISTEGFDIAREESARTTNTFTNLAAMGGSRAINANISKIYAQNTQANRTAVAALDSQYTDRNFMIAKENARIQDMYENRELLDLQGIGSFMQAGRETTFNGMSAMQSSLGYMANNGVFDKKKPTV